MQRYLASDLREAMRQVRAAQGPQAVILSHRKVPEGVEVVAAVDVAPPASDGIPTPPPAEAALNRELTGLRQLLARPESDTAELSSTLRERLLDLGLSHDLAARLALESAGAADLEQGWRGALARLTRLLPVDDDPILGAGGVVALVGPTGSGKSTTLAKLAARGTRTHGRRQVALVTTDAYRIGAYEQLQSYGHLLQVPVYAAADLNELRRTLASLEGRRLVLVDTAGLGQRDPRLAEELAGLVEAVPALRPYLVVPATAQRALLEEVVVRYGAVRPEGLVLTKVDEGGRLGGVFSVAIRERLAIAYLGTGQRVPEDLRPARAEDLVSRAVERMAQEEQIGEYGTTLTLDFGRQAEREHV